MIMIAQITNTLTVSGHTGDSAMEKLINVNDQLMNAPAGVLVMFFTFMIGLAMKKSNKIPNNLIPISLMCFGCVIWLMCAMTKFPTGGFREWLPWLGVNICLGFTFPGLTWMLHRLVIKNLMKRFGIDDNTVFLENPAKKEQTKDSNEKTTD